MSTEEKSDKPKLTYFNGPGRAEKVRLMFIAGEIEFEDARLQGGFAAFAKMKADPSSLPAQRFGTVPILQHGDVTVAQSEACAQYAADLGINKNVTAKQRAVDMQLLLVLGESQIHMYKCLFGDADSKKAGLEALPGAMQIFWPSVNKMLPQTGFVHGGDKPTMGDIAIYNAWTSPFPGLTALGQSVDDFPNVKSVVAAVSEFGPIKKYNEANAAAAAAKKAAKAEAEKNKSGSSYKCLCGANKYTVTAVKPALACFCHCKSCQTYSSGAAQALAVVLPSEVKVEAEDVIKYESSKGVFRCSCAKCGSFVYVIKPTVFVVPLPALTHHAGTDAADWEPSCHIFYSDDKLIPLADHAKLPTHKAFP